MDRLATNHELAPMKDLLAYLPYCGAPPIPGELWARWNWDPLLLLALGALCVWHAGRCGMFARSPAARPRRARACFIAGWLALALGLISPLCALSVALFSARVTQHMWLIAVAAPLLVLASSLSAPASVRREKSHPFAAAGLFAIALWSWHWPALYALTFSSDLAYWTMHTTLFGAALLLWRSLLPASSEDVLASVSAGFVTLTHMGLLGALITFASRELYAPHLLTTRAWGLTPLEDQQLGGLIMWIPTGIAFLVAALASVYFVLRAQEREHSAAA